MAHFDSTPPHRFSFRTYLCIVPTHTNIARSYLSKCIHSAHTRYRTENCGTNNTNSSNAITNSFWIEQIRQRDFVLITLITRVIIVLIALIIAVRRAQKRESWMYLNISSMSQVFSVQVFSVTRVDAMV